MKNTSFNKIAANHFLATRKGAGLVEYGLLVGLISVLAIGSVLATGEQVKAVFETTTGTLGSKMEIAESSDASEGSQVNEPEPTDSFTIIPGQSMSGGYVILGYSEGSRGSLQTQGDTYTLRSLNYRSDGIASVSFTGDHAAALQNASLSCEDGTVLEFASAGTQPEAYGGYPSTTSYQFSGVSGPIMTEGVAFNCEILE